MTRTRNEEGQLPPPAHLRLKSAPKLREAVVLAISNRPESPIYTTARKVTITNNAIDHVFDEFEVAEKNAEPWSVWSAAVAAVQRAREVGLVE